LKSSCEDLVTLLENVEV